MAIVYGIQQKSQRMTLFFPHLLFVDDCLLCFKINCSYVLVQDLIQKFCLASRLKTNVQKFKFLVSKNVPGRKANKFASIIGFGYTTNLGKYFGFPLLLWRVKKNKFSFILDCINNRLVWWKSKLCASRVTLTKTNYFCYSKLYHAKYLVFRGNLWHYLVQLSMILFGEALILIGLNGKM